MILSPTGSIHNVLVCEVRHCQIHAAHLNRIAISFYFQVLLLRLYAVSVDENKYTVRGIMHNLPKQRQQILRKGRQSSWWLVPVGETRSADLQLLLRYRSNKTGEVKASRRSDRSVGSNDVFNKVHRPEVSERLNAPVAYSPWSVTSKK